MIRRSFCEEFVDPFGQVPANRVIGWCEEGQPAPRAQDAVRFSEDPCRFDDMLNDIGAQDHVHRFRGKRQVGVEIELDRTRSGASCGGEEEGVVVRRDCEVEVTCGTCEDRPRAAPEIDDRCFGLEISQLSMDNVDLAVVDPAK